MNVQFLSILLRRLVHRRLGNLENWSPGEWSYDGGVGSKVSHLTGNSLRLTVERGDHIVPSFQEISGRNNNNTHTTDLACQKRKDLFEIFLIC